MFLALEREQVVLLLQLVETRLAELRAEIHAAQDAKAAADMQGEREQLELVLHQLHECACDVLA